MFLRMKNWAIGGLLTASFTSPCLAQQITFEPVAVSPSSTPSLDSPAQAATLPGNNLMPGCAPDATSLYGDASQGAKHQYYGRIEYLLLNLSKDIAPPLVTTGPQSSLGILGNPGVVTLYGGKLDQDYFHGGRLTVGAWMDSCQQDGIEASYFGASQQQTRFFAYSPGDPLLSRPFYNISPINFDGTPHIPGEDVEFVARESDLSGSVQVDHSTQLWGMDLNWRHLLGASCDPCSCTQWRLDAFVGLKYLQLNEDMTIKEDLLYNSPFAGNVRFVVVDQFAALNHFLGANIGLEGEVRSYQFYARAHGSIALGGTNQNVDIQGSTFIGVPNSTSGLYVGGLYALPSNIGSYSRTVFSAVPQVGVQLGMELRDCLRLFVGYDAFCWTGVVRPAEQIDRVINASQLPSTNGPGNLVGPARPAFVFNNTTLWGQSLSVGVEVRY